MLCGAAESSCFFVLTDHPGTLHKYCLIKCVCLCVCVCVCVWARASEEGEAPCQPARWWKLELFVHRSLLSGSLLMDEEGFFCCFFVVVFFSAERLMSTVSQNCSAKNHREQERRRRREITGYALLESSSLCLCACVKQTDAAWHGHRERVTGKDCVCEWLFLLPLFTQD